VNIQEQFQELVVEIAYQSPCCCLSKDVQQKYQALVAVGYSEEFLADE
jgi:hypothetical protein